MTPAAAVSWAARLGWLKLAGTRLAFVGHPIALIVFSLFAFGELVADKLPQAANRTAAAGLIARIVLGCLCAIAIALSQGGSLVAAAIVGVVGALAGTFAGYHARRLLVSEWHLPAFGVALVEDAIAVAGAFLIVSHV